MEKIYVSFRVPKYYGDLVEHKSIISEECVDPNAKKNDNYFHIKF